MHSKFMLVLALLAGAVEYTDWIFTDYPRDDIKPSDVECLVNEALRNAELPFISITPWSILIRRGSTW